MSFARADLLPLVLIIPALLALAVWLHARRRRAVARAFSDPHLIARLGGADLVTFPLPRLLLLMGAGAALACAAAGPRWGLRTAEGRALSLNIVLAADISKSMLAEDIEPNRLERARLFSRRLLRELPGDRFGLVVFAGRAYILSPLTVDHSAMELYLDALDPEMVSQGGSSLAAAIAQATDLVRGSEAAGGDRAVVLLSDGEALEEIDAVHAAAERAARAGVKFITVGVGTPDGANIPERDPATGEIVGMKRDEYGEVVVSRLDEEVLRSVAARTGGTYVRMDDGAAVERAVSELRGMQRTQGDNTLRVEPKEQFAWFAVVALLLLLADVLIYGPLLRSRSAARTRVLTPSRVRAMILLGAVASSIAFGIGDEERGNRLYREGRYEEAVVAYQRAIADADDVAPRVQYNLGTALLALGRYDEAEQHLRAALAGLDPELRQRAYYNLGNRFLQDARGTDQLEEQAQLLEAAAEAYRRTLRIEPDDMDAKWNLEMALREREKNEQQRRSMPQQQDPSSDPNDDQNQQSDPGGGSGSSPSQSQAGSGADPGSTLEDQPMTQAEADRILSAIEQDERELTRQKLRRGQRSTPVRRDW